MSVGRRVVESAGFVCWIAALLAGVLACSSLPAPSSPAAPTEGYGYEYAADPANVSSEPAGEAAGSDTPGLAAAPEAPPPPPPVAPSGSSAAPPGVPEAPAATGGAESARTPLLI